MMAPINEKMANKWTERPKFREGQKLTYDRFNRIHENQSARLRQAMLGLAGPGVVYGYKIATDADKKCVIEKDSIYIYCGLAIDEFGRQLYWRGGWVSINDLPIKPECADSYTLKVHYAERLYGSDGHYGCQPHETDWVEEGVVFCLSRHCHDETPPCPTHHEKCLGQQEYICSRLDADDGVANQGLDKLCEYPEDPRDSAPEDWLYDASSGQALACVKICDLTQENKDCDPAFGFCKEEPDICHHREYVYRNPLLFELIQGCQLDLGYVKDISFKNWAKKAWDDPVGWEEFATAIEQGLSVTFSKPMKKDTLHPMSIYFTAIVREQDSYFQDVLRFPIEKLEFINETTETAEGVLLKFPAKWQANQIKSDLSRFNFGATIEFTVRSSMLRDECDLMLDGRPLEFDRDKPGQAKPGDDFVVFFRVGDKINA